eukprot:gene23670-28229_t
MNISRLSVFVLTVLMLPLVFLISCKKNPDEQFNKAKSTVFQYISTAKDLNLYQAALKRAGIYTAETFSNGGPLTVFAPVDSAFINAGLTLDSINRYNPAALALILKYNIVYGKIGSGSLVGFYAEDALSLNGTYRPRLMKNYYGIFLDGAPLVTGASAELGDGVVHELRRMVFPPTTNLFDLINKSPDLTFFAAALKHIGYDKVLSLPPPPDPNVSGDAALYYTVFAPTDAAYKKFGYPDINAINAADPFVMKNQIDDYYLMRGKLLTSGFIGGYVFLFNNYYVMADGRSIFIRGNAEPTHIIRPVGILTNGALQETSGGLRGQIKDVTGQPIPGATVVAIHGTSGTRYATSTGNDGRYNLPGLRIGGPYHIE